MSSWLKDIFGTQGKLANLLTTSKSGVKRLIFESLIDIESVSTSIPPLDLPTDGSGPKSLHGLTAHGTEATKKSV